MGVGPAVRRLALDAWSLAREPLQASLREGTLSGHAEPLVVEAQLAALPRNLEPVRSRQFAGRGHERPGHVVLELEVRRDIVLDLDLVKAPEAAETLRATGGAEPPAELVELVEHIGSGAIRRPPLESCRLGCFPRSNSRGESGR